MRLLPSALLVSVPTPMPPVPLMNGVAEPSRLVTVSPSVGRFEIVEEGPVSKVIAVAPGSDAGLLIIVPCPKADALNERMAMGSRNLLVILGNNRFDH